MKTNMCQSYSKPESTAHIHRYELDSCAVLPSSVSRVLRKEVSIFLCALITVFAVFPRVAAAPQVHIGIVNRVVDGDTVWVNSGGTLLKVRISGIDAPEICQSHGPQAREALRRRLLGQIVTITYQRIDDYGRLLARVDLAGEDIGRWMVIQGHAWSYAYRNYPGPYAQEQQASSISKLGIFALDAAESPRSFRKKHGSCFP